MTAFFESTKIATRSNVKAVKNASAILLDYFNLNNFYYYQITESGDFFLFDDNVDVVDFLDSQQFILKYPHYCHPKFHKNPFEIEKTSKNPLLIGLKETQRYFLSSKFNLSLSIVNRTESAVEEFGFHSAQSNEEQSRFLFNHISELQLFTRWFLTNNRAIFSLLNENKVNLGQLLGNCFYTNRIQEADPLYQSKQIFFKELGIETQPNLSSAEIDTLKLVVEGYTALKIAKRLYRSTRTIEHRIENIKKKLVCHTRTELIQKYRELAPIFTTF